MQTSNYQTKTDQPVSVEAYQFNDYASIEEVLVWMGEEAELFVIGEDDGLAITVPTPDHTANQTAFIGDWIIKGKQGGFYVVKAEDFNNRYELSGPGVTPPAETVAEQLPADELTVDNSGPRFAFNEETDYLAPPIDIFAGGTIETVQEVDNGAPTEVVVEEVNDPSVPSEVIVDESTGETAVEEQPEGDENKPAENHG